MYSYREGLLFRESYATLLLRKVHGLPTHYVDLQSPAGIGLGGIVFNYDGKIYASDEGRMLAEMDDDTFCLGHLARDEFTDVMRSKRLWEPLRLSLAESSPSCSDCAVRPYCGSEPVYHHATQGDVCGYKPSSDFCARNMSLIKHLFVMMEDNQDVRDIFESWL